MMLCYDDSDTVPSRQIAATSLFYYLRHFEYSSGQSAVSLGLQNIIEFKEGDMLHLSHKPEELVEKESGARI